MDAKPASVSDEIALSSSSAFEAWDVAPAPGRQDPGAASDQSQGPDKIPLVALTLEIGATYRRANPDIRMGHSVPRRLLTHPGEGVLNGGHDNAESNLIVRVNDEIVPEKSHTATPLKYVVIDQLGQGTFGCVFHCEQISTEAGSGADGSANGRGKGNKTVAVKIVKNKPAYTSQAWVEVRVARLLNETYDPDDKMNIVRLLDFFEYKNHFCLVFEVLSVNLYELLKKNQFRGLPVATIAPVSRQVLVALGVMDKAKVIHCDLKPENLLLTPQSSAPPNAKVGAASGPESPSASAPALNAGAPAGDAAAAPLGLKVIDFGSACVDGEVMYSYIQSRFYRAPEVLLGLPYDSAIDMWSLGCIVAEMFLGLPIFPGVSEHNQVTRIAEMLGPTPDVMLEAGKYTDKFYRRTPVQPPLDPTQPRQPHPSTTAPTSSKFAMKTPQEYARDTATEVPVSKKYFKHSRLRDIVLSYPFRRGLSAEALAWEKERRAALSHFLHMLLQLLPHKRLTPRQALKHPFVTGSRMPHVRDNTAAAPGAAAAAAATTATTGPEAAVQGKVAAGAALADEDGYYWQPPDDLKLADRALKLMKHSKKGGHFDPAATTGHKAAARALVDGGGGGGGGGGKATAPFTASASGSGLSQQLGAGAAAAPPMAPHSPQQPLPGGGALAGTVLPPAAPHPPQRQEPEGRALAADAIPEGRQVQEGGNGGNGGARGQRRRGRGGMGGMGGTDMAMAARALPPPPPGSSGHALSASLPAYYVLSGGGGGGGMSAAPSAAPLSPLDYRGGLPDGWQPPRPQGGGGQGYGKALPGVMYTPPNYTPAAAMGFIDGAGNAHPFSFHQGFTDRRLLAVNPDPSAGVAGRRRFADDDAANAYAAGEAHGGGGYPGVAMVATSDFTYALQRPHQHARQPNAHHPYQTPYHHSMAGAGSSIGNGYSGSFEAAAAAGSGGDGGGGSHPRVHPGSYDSGMVSVGGLQHSRASGGGNNPHWQMYQHANQPLGSPGHGYAGAQAAAAHLENHPIWGSPMTAGHNVGHYVAAGRMPGKSPTSGRRRGSHYPTSYPSPQSHGDNRAGYAPPGYPSMPSSAGGWAGGGGGYMMQYSSPPVGMMYGSPYQVAAYGSAPQHYHPHNAQHQPPFHRPPPPEQWAPQVPPQPQSLAFETLNTSQPCTHAVGMSSPAPGANQEGGAPGSLKQGDQAEGSAGLRKVHSGLHQQLQSGSN